MFMVLKPVRYVDHEEEVDVSEIALFVGADVVASVQHCDSDVLGRVRAELDQGDSDAVSHGPRAAVHHIADMVVDG